MLRDFTKSDQEFVPDRLSWASWAIVGLAPLCALAGWFEVFDGRAIPALIVGMVAILTTLALIHTRFLHLARKQHLRSIVQADNKEREFRSIFENALDAILIFDAAGRCRNANPSALSLFGTPSGNVLGRSVRMFFSEPRDFDSLARRLASGIRCEGKAEFVRSDGMAISASFVAAAYLKSEHNIIVIRGTSLRENAHPAIGQILTLLKASSQQADALRRATEAMSTDSRMDAVLDRQLTAIREVVPFEHAQILLFENDSKLFLARQAPVERQSTVDRGFPAVFEIAEFPILQEVVATRDGVLIEDTVAMEDWASGLPVRSIRSWIGMRLTSSDRPLGILSLASSSPGQFLFEHLATVKSLAIPLAVAVRNARLYERAEMCGEELERRTSELEQVKNTLARFHRAN